MLVAGLWTSSLSISATVTGRSVEIRSAACKVTPALATSNAETDSRAEVPASPIRAPAISVQTVPSAVDCDC